jgi:hypothetical protein
MQPIFSRRPFVYLALAATLIAVMPASQAQSGASLDKHSRKIHHRLVKYPAGTYVNVVLRDGSQSSGVLAGVKSESFSITNSDNNVPETHDYTDVASVQKGREYIGAGSGGHHIHWVRWGIVGAAAAGAAATAFAVR